MWGKNAKVARGYTDFENMKELISRVSKMTHVEKRSLTDDTKLMNKVHKLTGDYYNKMLEEESKLGAVESVSPERHYTEYVNMKEIIQRCYSLTHTRVLSIVNESIVINKIHDISRRYLSSLLEEQRLIYLNLYCGKE